MNSSLKNEIEEFIEKKVVLIFNTDADSIFPKEIRKEAERKFGISLDNPEGKEFVKDTIERVIQRLNDESCAPQTNDGQVKVSTSSGDDPTSKAQQATPTTKSNTKRSNTEHPASSLTKRASQDSNNTASKLQQPAKKQKIVDSFPSIPSSSTVYKRDKITNDLYVELGSRKRITVNQFRGKTFVHLREYYIDANGDEKPTKKGLGLQLEQWQKLKELISVVDDMIQKYQ